MDLNSDLAGDLPPEYFFIGLTTLASHVFYANCQLSFFSGQYECRMTDTSQTLKYVARQRSDGEIIAQTTPFITVTPITIKVGCEVGKNVSLNCAINSPYVVQFKDIPEAGKHEKSTQTIVRCCLPHMNVVLIKLFTYIHMFSVPGMCCIFYVQVKVSASAIRFQFPAVKA